jgi:CHAT domain-containing protein
VGIATSLTRVLAPVAEAKGTLFVSAQVSGDAAGSAVELPGAEEERAALRMLGPVIQVTGERATPELVQELSSVQPLLHFAVHGFERGFLQLAGPEGRFGAHEMAALRLQPHARVVLSACESAEPGPRGLAWALARAGAAEIAAAAGKVDDAAAARWSVKFYAALGRGQPFVRAAWEASSEARFIVVK